MTVYEAWLKAKLGQKIYRASAGAPFASLQLSKNTNNLLVIRDKDLQDLSADDWEVVNDEYYFLPKLPTDTQVKVTFEWEE